MAGIGDSKTLTQQELGEIAYNDKSLNNAIWVFLVFVESKEQIWLIKINL
jgi:hypothetical protein